MTIEGTTKAHTKDVFMDGIGGSFSLFFLLIFIGPKYRFISSVVEEKASRAREGMKLMGLKDTPYWLSWFVYYLGVCITISLMCTVILVAFVFKNSSWLFVFLFVFLYGMVIYSYSMLICSLLQRPRVASIVATLIHFITYFLEVPVADPGVSTSSKTIASFLPNIAMALCVDVIAGLESIGDGVNANTLNTTINNFNVWITFRAWIIMFFILTLLALYLDNVLPKEYGTRQPFYFFLTPKWWCGSSHNVQDNDDGQERLIEDEDNENISNHKDFESISPTLRELEKTEDCMKVRNLRKVYDNGKVAVKNISLTIYNSQIFALLGHNGAGKTTTISMLTGIFSSSGGTAK